MKKLTVGILAHVDAGKTTLAEEMLYESGTLRKKGRVDHGDTLLDDAPVERERGITVFSSCASFEWGDTQFNLLDTPGHVDFSSETERILPACDAVILVISSADGVQSHTRTLWDLIKSYGLPVFTFVTKCDLGRTSNGEIMADLLNLSPGFVDMTSDGISYANAENIAESSLDLLEEYLLTGILRKEYIAKAISDRDLFPVFFGSGLKGDGVEEFLNALDELALPAEYTEDFSARVVKITRDRGDRLTHLKITGGVLRARDPVDTGDGEEKVNQIRFYNGNKFTTSPAAYAGDVCAVTGLGNTFAGQVIGDGAAIHSVKLEPVMKYRAVLPPDVPAQTFMPKIKLLCEEDPNLRAEWDEETSSVKVSLMGKVQAEILKRIVSERFGIDVDFDSGAVIYKETVADRVEGVGHYEPLRHYAEVHVMIEPAPRGSGIILGADCPEDVLEGRWQRLIMTHLAERDHLGVLTGSKLTDVKITLVAGRAHLKHTEGGDFRQAAYRAVRQGLMKAKSVLLEPYYSFVIEVPERDIGRAISDVKMMGGTFKAPVENDGMQKLCGLAPVKAMDTYMAQLSAYTGGMGKLTLSPGGYGECRDADRVVGEFAYDPESDLANSPDSVFCAHGAGFVVKWNEVENYMHVTREMDGAEKAAKRRANMSIDERELEEIMMREFGPIKRRVYSEPRRIDADKAHRVLGVKTYALIIDGYNVIFAWEDLRKIAESGDLSGARASLLNIVANYTSFTGCETVVVFDAYRVPGGNGEKFVHNGVKVVFTKENETADAYIERFVYNVGKNERVRVVTSDWLIQLTALRTGILRLSSAEFEKEVESVDLKIGEMIREHTDDFGKTARAEKDADGQ